jgi:hypothetical protein
MVYLKALSRYAHGEPDKYHEEFVEMVIDLSNAYSDSARYFCNFSAR